MSDQTHLAPAVGTIRYLDSGGWHSVVLDAPSTSIGRSTQQDIVLADPKVSRLHALILRDNRTYSIIDQNSTGGTFLNGQPIQRAILKHADVLQFGSLTGAKLRFFEEPEAHTPEDATSLWDLLSSRHLPRADRDDSSQSIGQMEQLTWLLRAARQLNQGGAIDDILRALLQLTLQLTGVERGFVLLCDSKELHIVLGLNADGVQLPNDSPLSRRAIDQAIASDSKFSVSDTLADKMARNWSSLHANQIRSIFCIPLRTPASNDTPSRLLGLVYLDSRKTATLSPIDDELLDAISTESAALVHNALLAAGEREARRAAEELAVAARIHRGLMSLELPLLPYATLAAKSIPCLAIGGDFYDAVVLDNSVCVAIVDVSGKGVSAAIVAATLQGIIHAQLLSGQALPDVAALVNRFLCSRNVGKYATMVLLRLFSNGRIEYLNCGHIAPIAIHDGNVRTLAETNLIVGLIGPATYVSNWDQLRPGERILLVTDGITESENPEGQQFGEQQFPALVHNLGLDDILEAVASFQGPRPAADDCTLIELRYLGQQESF